METNWIRNEILTGFQKLLTLGLDRTPAGEVLPGTAMTWLETITDGRKFEQERDTPRFRAAFRTLQARSTHWPAPREFLEALPRLEGEPRLKRLERPEARAAGARAIAEITALLGLNEPPQTFQTPEEETDDFQR